MKDTVVAGHMITVFDPEHIKEQMGHLVPEKCR